MGSRCRTASRARWSCCAVLPESPGRSSALPPKATTASGRTKEKKGVLMSWESGPGTGDSGLEPGGRHPSELRVPSPVSRPRFAPRSWVVPDEGHRHAPRAAPRAGQLVRGQAYDAFALAHVQLLATQKQIGLVHDTVAGAPELFGRPNVAVIEKDDPGREREGVGAVGPLLPAFRDRIVSSAADRREVEALGLQGGQQVLLRSPADLPPCQVALIDIRFLFASRENHRTVNETLLPRDRGKNGIQVHRRAGRRNGDHDDPPDRGALGLEALRQPLDRGFLGSLRIPDREKVGTQDQNVSSFECRAHASVGSRRGKFSGELLKQEDPIGTGEARVVLEDVAGEEWLPDPRRGRHGAADDAVSDHHERVPLEEIIGSRRQPVQLRGGLRLLPRGLLDPGNEGQRQILSGKITKPG